METRTITENGTCKVYNADTGQLVYKEIEVGDRIIFMNHVDKNGVSFGDEPWRLDKRVWATCVNRDLDLLGTVTSVGKAITIAIDSKYQKQQVNCPKEISICNTKRGLKVVNIRLKVRPFLVNPITPQTAKQFS